MYRESLRNICKAGGAETVERKSERLENSVCCGAERAIMSGEFCHELCRED